MSPTDEVRQLASCQQPPVHTPFHTLAAACTHPFIRELTRDDNPVEAAASLESLICLVPGSRRPTSVDPFLPPKRLLDDMEAVFAEKLQERLWAVLERIVNVSTVMLGSEEDAEKETAKWDNVELLRIIRQPSAWLREGVRKHLPQVHQNGPPARESSVSGMSPRVEPVEDELTVDPDYGIEENSSSGGTLDETVEEDEYVNEIQLDTSKSSPLAKTTSKPINIRANLHTPEGSPVLGKRKLAPTTPVKHSDLKAPLTIPQNTPIHFGKARHRGSPTAHGVTPLREQFELEAHRHHHKSSPPSMQPSAGTMSTFSTGPMPITPGDSDRREFSDTSDAHINVKMVSNDREDEYASSGDMTDLDCKFSSEEPALSNENDDSGVEIIADIDSIPWIPAAEHELGPRATDYLMAAWRDARSRLKVCRCRVCSRAKKKTLEEQAWSWTVAGNGEKRLRLG